MKSLLKAEMEVPCPGGSRPLKISLDKILSSSTLKTQKGEYKLKSISISKLKNHLKNMEKEQEKFEKTMEKMQKEFAVLYSDLFKTADIMVKR